MNTKSLNRSIGLAMSALQQARANGYSVIVIEAIRNAIRLLNRARNYLKSGKVSDARFWSIVAHNEIKFAIGAR